MNAERLWGAAQTGWNRAGDGLLAVAVFAASLAAYVQTLAPSVASLFDDSLEFPLVCHDLAVAHPTGYPLYTLLCHLFTLGPWRNVAWGVNLLSAVAGALAVALVYLAARQVTRRRWPALVGALALAASPIFWSQSVIAEVYTLNSAFVAALLWLALRWAGQPLRPVTPFCLLLVAPRQERPEDQPNRRTSPWLPAAVRQPAQRLYLAYRRFFPAVPPKRRLQPHPLLFGLVLVYALSLAHHRTMVLLAPALVAYLLLIERRALGRAALLGPEHPDWPRWRQVVRRPGTLLVASFLAPLLLYVYLPARGHVGSLDGTYANTWSGFWRWVMASGYGAFLGDNPLARDLDFAWYLRLFWAQFGPVGLALALVGLVGLAHRPGRGRGRSRRGALVLTGLAFLTYALFAAVYRVPDVEVFFLPAFLVVSVWIGAGLDHAADRLRPRGSSPGVRRLLAACGLLLLVAAVVQPFAIAVRNYPDVDLSRRWGVHDYGLYALEQPLPANSSIVGLLGEMTLLRYFQRTLSLRPDIQTVPADAESARREAVRAALDEGRAVYVTRPLPGLSGEHSVGAVTGLIDAAGDLQALLRVDAPAFSVPDVPHRASLEPAPGLRMLGYGVLEHRAHWQAWARLRLWWQAPDGLEAPLKVSARLVDPGGRVVAAADAEPVSGAYPTTAWRPGEVVADAYEIPLPAGLPPGEYTPVVLVYDPATGAELGRAELSPVHLQGNPLRPPRRTLEAGVAQPAYALLGDVELLGFTPPSPELAAIAHRGDALPLLLLWQARGRPAGELRIRLWLEGRQDKGRAGARRSQDYVLAEEAVGGQFPAARWQDGQTVRQWLTLPVPDGVPAGSYRLKMRVTRDGQPVPWGRGLVPLGSDLDLGAIEVIG